jgi:hypothetical protein
MRLVNYGIGEISDRLSILALKILHCVGDAKHFRDERNALLVQIRAREATGKWFEHYNELAAVNAAIWYFEDELRQWRATKTVNGANGFEPIVRLAFRLQELNDRRADLIVAINKDSGDHVGAEKV